MVVVLLCAGAGIVWWLRDQQYNSASVSPAMPAVAVATPAAQSSPAAAPAAPEPAAAAQAPPTPIAPVAQPQAPGATLAPFKPGEPFKLDPIPPGHAFKLHDGHKDTIYDIAIFPDQRHAATASADGTIGVWDLQTGERIRTFGPVEGYVARVVVSPDGRAILSSGNTYKISVWDIDGPPGIPAAEIPTTSRNTPILAFSDNGSAVIFGTNDLNQSLMVWEWKKPGPAQVVPGIRFLVNGLDRTPALGADTFVITGQRVDSGRSVTEAWVVDLARRSLVRQLGDPPSALSRAHTLRDGRGGFGLVTGRMTLWDTESGKVLARSDKAIATYGDIEFLDSDRLVLYGTNDRCLHIVETITCKEVWTSSPSDSTNPASPTALADGRYVVTADNTRASTTGTSPTESDFSLHVWALPDLSTLQSGEAEKAAAARQMLTLEKDDPELWSLLARLEEEWTKAISAPTSHKDLDEKYLAALRREMNTASPRDREAYLTEISRIANGTGGVVSAGSPRSLARLHDIYQEQIALLPRKASAARADLIASHRQQLDALATKRSGNSDAEGAARVQLVAKALSELNGEMDRAKVLAHFLPPAPPEVTSLASPSSSTAITRTTTTISVQPGTPVPKAVGNIPPYGSPLRGLSRPAFRHKVEVWARNNKLPPPQTALSKIPSDLGPVVALAVGSRHALALKPDGTVVQWGNEDSRVLGVPDGVDHIVAIDAGSYVSACLRDDGALIAWNTRELLAQHNESRPAVGITATFSYVMLQHADGGFSYVLSPSFTGTSVYTPPSDLKNCTQVCAATGCAFALRQDGTVIGWGRSTRAGAYNMTDNMPQSDLVDGICIASNSDLGFLLKRSGEIVAWGQRLPTEFSSRPRFPGATKILGGRPSTGLVIGFQPGVWKFLSLSDNRYPIDTETADRLSRGCTQIGVGQYYILGLRPM